MRLTPVTNQTFWLSAGLLGASVVVVFLNPVIAWGLAATGDALLLLGSVRKGM